MSNFNVTNMTLLLVGALLIMAAYLNRSVTDIIKGVLSGDMSVFTGVPAGQEKTGSSSGQTGFNGDGGFTGGTGDVGSW